MSTMYRIEGSAFAGPITPPRSRASLSPSPELIAKVNDWVNVQSAPLSSDPIGQTHYERETIIEEQSPDMSPERKKVHWTPNIRDNQGKTVRKPKSRLFRQEDKMTFLPSKLQPRTRQPSVPDPPRSRGPPPAPRPRRLPTPELPELKCNDFCDCCYTGAMSKMDAQLAAAASHIVSARQSVRRLT